jgi:hypothetical protein
MSENTKNTSEEVLARYTLSNSRVRELVEKHDLKYSQARRKAMSEDGMSISDIASIEGISKGVAQSSVYFARDKIADPGIDDCDPIYVEFMPEEEVRKCVLEFISKLPKGEEICTSDIAREYGIDLDCIYDILDKLADEGIVGG